jgi:UDP:flavonoid glycosyltransferase YjiC (YdhE family)
VTLETWSKWREHVEREGMSFAAAPEYQVFPTRERALKPYAAAVRASAVTRELIRSVDPQVVVADILTVAAALAAELEERPWVTLVPHVMPMGQPGFPIYALGAVPARTPAGERLWRLTRPLLMKGEQQGQRELNGARERVGLPPLSYVHGGISRELALVATFPQLEYPRPAPEPWMQVTGPLMWEQPFGDVELPPGSDPLVLVAPSTSQDPERGLLRAALTGLADEPVRVLAVFNRRTQSRPLSVPDNARVADWLSYARTMPRCQAVVCQAGHGTLARALHSGVPVVACPYGGDQAETASRVRWAGVGVSLPRRFHTPRGLRLAVRRVLDDPGYAERTGALARWSAGHDGPVAAADAVERVAGRYPLGVK